MKTILASYEFMIARVRTTGLYGLSGVPVDVEVQLRSANESHISIIGLGDSAVRESRDRVLAAIRAAGFPFPKGVVLVNLAPAELKKEGSSYDLPIALGILIANQQLSVPDIDRWSIHGELALDGRVKGIRGAAALAIGAREAGAERVIVPAENADEAALLGDGSTIAVESLAELVAILRGEVVPEPLVRARVKPSLQKLRNLDQVWGQERAKRAMIIAAAGGHNLLMIGPPGCGKSMLAQTFPGLLPPLTPTESLEVVRIYSVSGQPVERLLDGSRPFRNPHHVVSDVGLVGGGPNPRPGEISLAHRGVLFLDEFPEFRRSALEALRAPLENGEVSIVRSRARYVFPSRFQLIAAMNPCPCGRLGIKQGGCLCSLSAIQNYLRRLSQPILDRIDLHVELEAIPLSVMTSQGGSGTASHDRMVELVANARQLQTSRQAELNSQLDGEQLMRSGLLDAGCLALLEHAGKKLELSARTLVRLMRVARTIADLAGAERIKSEHLAEAINFRSLERLQKYARAA